MYTFIETILFSRLVQDYLSDDDYRRLQVELIENAGHVLKQIREALDYD